MSGFRKLFMLAPLLSLSASAVAAGASTTSADCLFNWAEKTYPALFSPASSSQALGNYYFRAYAGTKNFLALANDSQHFLYVGAGLADLGNISDWLSLAGCQSATPPTNTNPPAGTTTGGNAATDLAEIKTQFASFQSLFATGLPSASAIQAFFDQTFLNNGGDGVTTATNWAKALPAGQANLPLVAGVQFTVELTSAEALDAGQSNVPGSVEWVTATASYPGYSGDRDSMRVKMIKDAKTGQWLMAGNQRLIKAKLYSGAVQVLPSTIATGLHVRVSSKFTAANGASPQVVVTGPGLPAAGVVLSVKTGDGWLVQDVGNTKQFVTPGDVPSCASLVAANYPNCTNLLDPALVDGAVYTFRLNDAAGSVYHDKLKKVPLADGSVTPAMFPSLNVSPTSLSALVTGTTSTISFTLPAGSSSWYAQEFWNAQTVVTKPVPSTTTTSVASGYSLAPGVTSASFSFGTTAGTTGTMVLPTGSTVVGGLAEIMSMDANGRLFSTFQLFP